MATQDHIIRLADCRAAKPDPAYFAKLRMDAAGEHDDAAYMQGIIDLETAQPTSLLGVCAVFGRLRWYHDFFEEILDQGGKIGRDDWDIVHCLCEAIDQALEKFTANVA